MRVSRYTIECTTNVGEHVLYNTATGAFALLDNESFLLYKSGEPPFADELKEAGFTTELTPEDELAVQQAAFDAVRSDRSHLTLSIVPTYACNYRCPYCYELGHNKVKGKMDANMRAKVLRFVEDRHASNAFTGLSIQWYGGDPSLALDVVEALSVDLIDWCENCGVSYDATMITNANIVGEREADLLAQLRVRLVFLTIDGPEEMHNRRRVAADGSNSYERNIRAARLLRARGVRVFATMNVDKVSWTEYPTLRNKLKEEEGIELTPGKLCDYGHFFGEAPFCPPAFDLFTHEEFARERLKLYETEGHTREELRELLRPAGRFCTGQLDNYFVIDLLGDVYNCDGWVGEKEHVRFNLLDDPSTWQLADISHDPTRDVKCRECTLLPVCMGSCMWERACNGWPCHPFKYTMEGYLNVYRNCFEQVARGFTRLA